MSEVFKCITQLMQLKEVQQQSIRIIVNTLYQKKDSVKKNMLELESEIRNNDDQAKNFSRTFYQELKTKSFDNKDMRHLTLTLEKFRMEGKELLTKQQKLATELANLENELAVKTTELRSVVIKQEKYNYLIADSLNLQFD